MNDFPDSTEDRLNIFFYVGTLFFKKSFAF